MSVQCFRYIGSGPENDELLARVREKAEAVYAARKALSDEYGAQGFLMDYWSCSKPEGIYFTEPQDLPFLKWEQRRGVSYGELPCGADPDCPDKILDKYNTKETPCMGCRMCVLRAARLQIEAEMEEK